MRLKQAMGQRTWARKGCGHPGSRNAGATRAAIGLQYIAIELQRTFSERGQIEYRAQATAYKTLDFLCAAALLAFGGLAIGTGMRGARQDRKSTRLNSSH